MLPPHWVVPPSGGAAWGRRRAETHEAAHRRGFRGVKRRARRIFASREAIGCVIRSSACCNPTTALQGIDRTCVTAPSPTPTLTRTSRRDRGRTAAESGHVLSSPRELVRNRREIATRPTAPRGAKRIATLARSGQQACAGTCALRHHSRHNSAPALPPPSDDVRWGQSTPASSLIAREARPLAAASDLRRRLDRRWPRWRPT